MMELNLQNKKGREIGILLKLHSFVNLLEKRKNDIENNWLHLYIIYAILAQKFRRLIILESFIPFKIKSGHFRKKPTGKIWGKYFSLLGKCNESFGLYSRKRGFQGHTIKKYCTN